MENARIGQDVMIGGYREILRWTRFMENARISQDVMIGGYREDLDAIRRRRQGFNIDHADIKRQPHIMELDSRTLGSRVYLEYPLIVSVNRNSNTLQDG
jgi:hypothetical protein